jgi:hypothetical protein
MTENEEPQPRTFHGYRARVLERAVRLEVGLDGALAASYARNQSTATELQGEVLWRLPITQRVDTLGRVIHERALAGRFGFVAPFLAKYFRMRHTFAHSIGERFAEGDTRIRLYSVKQGKQRSDSFTLEQLSWMEHEASRVQAELIYLYFALAPQAPEWHEDSDDDGTQEASSRSTG